MQATLQIGIPLVLLLMMWLVGLDLRWSEVVALRNQISLLVWGTVGQWVLVPSLLVALSRLVDVSQEQQIGLLLVAAAPGGAISNTYTSLARGNVALSIALTALSCSLAFVSLPLICWVGGWALGQSLWIRAPMGGIMLQLVLFVLAPIAAGVAARHYWPRWVAAQERLWRRLSLLAIVSLLALVVLPEFQRFLTMVPRLAPLVAAWTVLAGGTGWGLGYWRRADHASCQALAIEFAVRNLGIAALVGLNAMNQVDPAVLAALCFVIQVPLLLAAALCFRRISPVIPDFHPGR